MILTHLVMFQFWTGATASTVTTVARPRIRRLPWALRFFKR